MGRSSRGTYVSLFVRNISHRTRPEDLRRAFEKYGPIKDVYIPKDFYTGESRGFAFVQFLDIRDAEDAKRYMDRSMFDGREIAVMFAEEDRKTPGEMRDRERRVRRSRYSRTPSRSRSRSPRRRYSRSRSRSRGRDRQRSYSASPRHRSARRSESRSLSRHQDRSLSRSPAAKRPRHSEGSPYEQRAASAPRDNGASVGPATTNGGEAPERSPYGDE